MIKKVVVALFVAMVAAGGCGGDDAATTEGETAVQIPSNVQEKLEEGRPLNAREKAQLEDAEAAAAGQPAP